MLRSALARYAHWLHLRYPGGNVTKLPEVDEHYRSSQDGVYVVGDLAGIPLLKFSVDSGARAVAHMAETGLRPGEGVGERVDVAILGAGTSGMAAAKACQRHGFSFEVLEASRRFHTIKDFQKRKPIYTYPNDMEPAGDLRVTAEVKEALVDELERQVEDIPVRCLRAERIEREEGGFRVVTDGEPVHARRVVVAIGRSGNYRQLGVPGEHLDKVHHRLHDPAGYVDQNTLVVGGGDAAAEAAIALAEAGAHVTLSYRREALSRPKPENAQRVRDLADEGALRLVMASTVREIRDDDVALQTPEGDEDVPNDVVFAMIGREAPLDFFRRSGLKLRNDWGETPDTLREALHGLGWLKCLNLRTVLPMVAFVTFMGWVYSLTKDGLLARVWSAQEWFPYSLDASPVGEGVSMLEVLRVSASSPSFYYTVAYSVIVVVFGWRRVRRRKTPYIKVQTTVLAAIQVVPLFLLPEILLPWLGGNGWLSEGLLDALFPVAEYGHGREYWRAYGFILAWPLYVYNVFTADPLWWWLGISFVQTFVLIPGMIYFWGKGAYCSWICSCGALAETLGDGQRHKMPHGPSWNRFNLAGQVILGIATFILFVRILGWMAGWGWLDAFYNQMLFGSVLGLQLNYYWLVDVVLAGMIGYGVYFWLSGRFWCRFLCPLAALMHVYTKFSRFRILADKKKCISCNVCTSVCHQGIDVMSYAQVGQAMDDPQCVRCSACVQSCPTGVLTFGQVDRQSGVVITTDALEASLARLTEERPEVRREHLPKRAEAAPEAGATL